MLTPYHLVTVFVKDKTILSQLTHAFDKPDPR